MMFACTKNRILIFITFLICTIGIQNKSFAQYEGDDTIYVYESLSDSMDLASNEFDVADSAGYYFFNFFDESSEVASVPVDLSVENMEDWNNEVLFYNRSFDPTKIQDSILVVLQDNEHKFIPPRFGIVTSKFGWRRSHFHYGIDIDLETGDTVRSAFDGIVRIAKMGWGGGYGNVIIIRHANGFETLYGHLNAINVQPNQAVRAGDLIGLGGNTGRSFGSHLHFEMRYHGIAMNPEHFLDFSNFKMKRDSVYLSKRSFGYVNEIKKVAASHIKYYKVKNGDSLSKIAAKNGTTVSAICKLNRIKSTKVLRVGQTLRVR